MIYLLKQYLVNMEWRHGEYLNKWRLSVTAQLYEEDFINVVIDVDAYQRNRGVFSRRSALLSKTVLQPSRGRDLGAGSI